MIIYNHYHQVALLAQISLTPAFSLPLSLSLSLSLSFSLYLSIYLSIYPYHPLLPGGFLNYILCPCRSVEGKFLLVD